MHDTGADGYTAMAMVADVRDRGSHSPHAEVVSAAAQAILAPIIDVFAKFFADLGRAVTAWAEAVGRSMQPLALAALDESGDTDGD